MTGETDIPLPVLFNPFKHHRSYIERVLKEASPGTIISLLEPVCNNYTDIYTGGMTPKAIGNEVIHMLRSKQVLQEDHFTKWIASKNGYQHIKLKDQSEWIVRRSDETDRYIHLHPARTGAHTVRFKGSTLKTIYRLKAGSADFQELPSLEEVNRTRIEIALSPVKKLEPGKGILKCYEKFFCPGRNYKIG